MNEVLGLILGYGSLSALYVGAFVAAAGLMLGALVWPQLLLFGVLATSMVFPSSPSNALGGESGFNAYGKGGGYLVFSLFELALMALALALPLHGIFRRRFAPHGAATFAPLPNPYTPYFFGLFVLYLGYVLVDLLTPGAQFMPNLSRGGVINLFFQWCLVAALLGHVTESGTRNRVAAATALILMLEMAWGLLRYVALGGDPQSSYEGEGGGFLKLTFWDINYSILAAMAASWAIWRASLVPAERRGQLQMSTVGWTVLALLLFAIIGLSGRRTAQVGAALTLLVLIVALPRGRRWLAVVIIALAMPVAVYKVNARLNDDRPLIEKLFKGTERRQYLVDPRYERTYELKLAWAAVKKEPFFGVGPAGTFNPMSAVGIEFHKGNYGFIHSGFGHVLLKFGFVGLLIFAGLFFEYGRQVWSRWRTATPVERGWIVTSLGGMACALPNLVSGTPIIEIRSMVVLGVILAMPLLARRA